MDNSPPEYDISHYDWKTWYFLCRVEPKDTPLSLFEHFLNHRLVDRRYDRDATWKIVAENGIFIYLAELELWV